MSDSESGVPRNRADDGADEEDQPVDERPDPESISPVTFKTSGSFFRERVARNLEGWGSDSSADTPEESTTAASEADQTDATDEDEDEDEPATEAFAVVPEAPAPGDPEPGADEDPVTEAVPAPNAGAGTEASGDSAPAPDEADTDTDPEGDIPTTPVTADAVAAASVFSPGAEAESDTDTDPSTQPIHIVAGDGDTEGSDVTEADDSDAVTEAEVTEAAGAEADESDAVTEAVDTKWPEASVFEAPPTENTLPETPETRPVESGAGSPPQMVEPSSATTGGEGSQPAEAAAETLWPKARRLSDYGSDRSEQPDLSTAGAAATAVAAAAAFGGGASGGPGAAGSPGGAVGASGPHDASAGSAHGPGGPKGPGGPGGPTGPGGTGPGQGKKGRKPKKPLWWRLVRTFLIVAGLAVIAGCSVFAYLYSTVEVPDAAKADAIEQGSTFYFADGEAEFAYRGTNRDVISYDEMTAGGDHVVEAVVSAEDRGFWTEPGVSVSGTARAVWTTVTGEQVQGGSTVTQQMVRNYYEGVGFEQTVARKLQEIIISIKVDQSESKEWVMEQYLNTIYFGRQAYGVQAAAQAYYHKDVEELTPEEAAFLSAAIQQPTHFGTADVETTPAMESRWQYVVDGMVITGAITQAEAGEMEFPAPEPDAPQADIGGYKGYMLQEAMRELEELGYTEDQIQRQGFKIVTTFDEDMMEAAYEAVEEAIPPGEMPEGVNVGLSTIDHETGEVLAFYGGHDYVENAYDSAFLGAAPAGSAFKPYVLATALEQGVSLNSTVDGRGPRTIQGSEIGNAGGAAGGVMTLTEATQRSNNIGYVELAQEVGFEEIRQTAYDVGLPEGSIGDNQLVPVMPLGATSVRPIDQATGFSTFANGGEYVETHVVKEIVNIEGENERPEIEHEQALAESTAADVTYALQQVVSSGTGTGGRLWDHPTAGKTGTATPAGSPNGTVAAWFVGYTPQLTTSVGVYNGTNEGFTIQGRSLSGGGLPANMWNTYMTEVMRDYEPGSFPSPAFGGTTEYWGPDLSTVEPEEPEGSQGPDDSTPEEPEVPITPEEPEVPITPEEPEEPVTPEDPEPGPGTDPPPPSRTEEE